MPKPAHLITLSTLLLAHPAHAAEIVAGPVADLGTDFIFNTAAIGGGDNNSTNFTRNLTGIFTAGAEVSLTGIAWASSAAGTTATNVTAIFTDPGPDGAFDTADDIIAGTVADALVFSGASTYVWSFDAPVAFTSSNGDLRIQLNANGNVRRKTTSGTTQAAVKLSLAGTAIGGTPPPATPTANTSGFWEEIPWDTGTGTINGGLNEADTAVVGNHHAVTYRGIPADENVAGLNLGHDAANQGQGTLIIESGSLTVNGNLAAGRNASENDSFLFANGGTLNITGNADFGRNASFTDGSLIVAGGSVNVAGNLAMGAVGLGGSMLRFHNPGSSAPVHVGGSLVLGRCSLDLTFDANYTHTPGTVTTLTTYTSRDGQFLNFRRGEEFHRGPHRFRIDYDVDGTSITLTALPDWETATKPPNVILIFTDDQGYADLQLNGHPDWAARYPMPRLQQLADSGARFTDAYVTGGVCHPSRVGLLTGRYQQRIGSDNNLGGANGMAPAVRTVPDRLQALGIRTYGIGKWHLGNTVEYHPNVRGFDRWYGMWGGSRSYYEALSETNVFQDQMTPKFEDETGLYLTDRTGDSAVNFIDEHLATAPEQPFFMYVSFTAPHGPNDLNFNDPRFARLESEFGLTQADYTDTPNTYGDKAKTELERYRLAGMTLAIDDNVGKILDKLAAENLTEDTIVVYLNDNGGAGWVSGFGGNWSYNYPLRGLKGGSMTDGSIRVPAAITWPGTIPAGQVINTPVIALDFMATFVNAGGAPPQARNGLDGLDLLPLLRDGTPLPAERALTWRSGGVNTGGSAIRVGDWKVLYSDTDQSRSLYNIRNNPAENNNLAASEPALFDTLTRRFQAWESSILPPFYGGGLATVDTGLQRYAISGGYRIKNPDPSHKWLSATFRQPIDIESAFHFRFLARPCETAVATTAELAYALGDSGNRTGFIRLIIDYGNNQIRIEDGKSGASASAPMPAWGDDFLEASIDYRPAGRVLTFEYAGASTSLSIDNAHGNLTHFAVGTAAMEGELSTLVPSDGRSIARSASVALTKHGGRIDFSLATAAVPPFDPALFRSPDLASGFAADPNVLIENYGGGLYRATTPTAPDTPSEFFIFSFR